MPVQFRVTNNPEAEATIKVLDKDSSQIRLEYSGCTEQEARYFLQQLDDKPTLPDQEVVDVQKWQVLSNGQYKVMVTGRTGPHSSDIVRDWSDIDCWDSEVMEIKKSQRKQEATIRRQTKNFRVNLDKLDQYKSVQDLFGEKNGETACIVGAGPSLRFNKDDISEDSTVFAINRANTFLDPCQIDFSVCIDRLSREEWLIDHVRKTSNLLLSPIAPPELAEGFQEVYTYRPPESEVQMRDADRQAVSSLPYLEHKLCATYTAFHLAYLAGFDRIEFYGQDFCTDGDLYYVDGRMNYERYDPDKWDIVPDLNGNAVLTNDTFRRCAETIKGQSAFVANRGIEIVNASERGLLDLESYPCNGEQETNLPDEELSSIRIQENTSVKSLN